MCFAFHFASLFAHFIVCPFTGSNRCRRSQSPGTTCKGRFEYVELHIARANFHYYIEAVEREKKNATINDHSFVIAISISHGFSIRSAITTSKLIESPRRAQFERKPMESVEHRKKGKYERFSRSLPDIVCRNHGQQITKRNCL